MLLAVIFQFAACVRWLLSFDGGDGPGGEGAGGGPGGCGLIGGGAPGHVIVAGVGNHGTAQLSPSPHGSPFAFLSFAVL